MENDNGGLTDSFHTCREEACLSFSTPPSGLTGRCSQKVQVDVGEKNWTLTAQNKLGKVTLYDHADLSRRGKGAL